MFSCNKDSFNKCNSSGSTGPTGPTGPAGTGSDISANLDLSCNAILDVSNIDFCQNIVLTDTANATANIAIGNNTGYSSTDTISIGHGAGSGTQGTPFIAIGKNAGATTAGNNTIILNATGSDLSSQPNGNFYVAPIRENTGDKGLYYNTLTNEITYDTAGSGGTDFSFNYYFTQKPQFVTDPSGKYDINDERIELEWNTPPQERASNNYISAPHMERNTNVFTPSLPGVTGMAQYYPASHNFQGGILNLIVPSVSTGFYSSPGTDPLFNDLNYLPYHQYLGVDYRTENSGTITSWQPITPQKLGFSGTQYKDYGEQNLWYQTKGLYIKDAAGLSSTKGDYSPNTNPGPGGSQKDYIYQLEQNPDFSSTSGDRFQFRIYLTNNSDELLTATAADISFNSEDPPYWRYVYIPDNCNNFLTFGSPGFATPPRNISNGATGQPTGTSFTNNPTQTYRTLIITGANNNADPFVDPNGSPAASSSDSTSPADTSLNVVFSQLSTYSLSVNYGFDISMGYVRDASTPWGEQNNKPTPTLYQATLTSSNIESNSWSTSSNFSTTSTINNPANTANEIIYPGYSYFLNNYFMRLNSTPPNTVYTAMFVNDNGQGGGGDSVGNSSIQYSKLVVEPPSRTDVSTDYNSYLTSTDLYTNDTNSWTLKSGNQYILIDGSELIRADTKAQFNKDVFFLTLGGGTANQSVYDLSLNLERNCVNNKNNSTAGWGTNAEVIIGDDLSNFSSGGGLSRFIFSSLDQSTAPTLTTDFAGAWGSSAPAQQVDPLLKLTVSASKDAVTSGLSTIQDDRLHGWYMGIDVLEATALGINLVNYPDIAIRASPNDYSPYNFKLKQEIDTGTTNSVIPTSVGSNAEYDLYIAEIEGPIIWNPISFSPLTIPMVRDFFGLNRPDNTIISPTGFDISGTLTDISTRWYPVTSPIQDVIMDGEIKYYKEVNNVVSSVNLQNTSKDFNESWPSPASSTQIINKQLEVTTTDLSQNSMNYSRISSYTPQFRISGNYRNNVALTPTLQDYDYDCSFTAPNLLWWDYTYEIFNNTKFINTTLSNTGTDSSGGVPWFYPDNPGPTNNGFFGTYNHGIVLPFNQLMWTDGAFRSGQWTGTSTKDPYINYFTNFHNQPSDSNYNTLSASGEQLSISYQPVLTYYRDLNSTTTITSISGTYKWINVKVVGPDPGKNSITVTVKDENNTQLILGTDYMLFICEKATFQNLVGSPESPYSNRSGWKDACRTYNSALSAEENNTDGVGINRNVWPDVGIDLPPDSGGPLAIFKSGTANLELYLRIGLQNSTNKTIGDITFVFTDE